MTTAIDILNAANTAYGDASGDTSSQKLIAQGWTKIDVPQPQGAAALRANEPEILTSPTRSRRVAMLEPLLYPMAVA